MPGRLQPRTGIIALMLCIGSASCGADNEQRQPSAATSPSPPAGDASGANPSPSEPSADVTAQGNRPSWLGKRPLPLRPDGFGMASPTPPELVDRRLTTVDLLPAPPGETFESNIDRVPIEVVARSTWAPGCPVSLDDLRYVKVSFVGFDDRFHTGEIIVHRRFATGIVQVFRRLHTIRFPIEEMKVVTVEERDAPPTGDGNNTTGFVCRPATGLTSWSEHAYGMAIDVNPFHNPYLKGDLVLPELAGAYVDRSRRVPGMIFRRDELTTAFAAIGWSWGGNWRTLKDWMHFSSTGR